MFLWWSSRCKTFNGTILILLTNRNVAVIYSVTICEQKTKDYARSGSFQHKPQHRFFLFLILSAFHSHSPLLTMHDKTIFCSLTKLESAFELVKKVTINLQLRNLVLNATCSLNNALRDHSSKRSLPLVFLNLHLYTKVATFSAPTG